MLLFFEIVSKMSEHYLTFALTVTTAIIGFIFVAIFFIQKWNYKLVRVKELLIYPIKSCKGISLKTAKIGKRGFAYDRQWLIVNKSNNMVTQRTCPKLILIETDIVESENSLYIGTNGIRSLRIPLDEPQVGEVKVVTVWDDDCESIDMGDEVASWISTFLEVADLRLVRMTDSFVRKCDPKYAPEGQTGFSDGFPFLLTSDESIMKVNNELKKPIEMKRFRPNIVVSGAGEPFQEDKWKKIRISHTIMNVVKPCSRCRIPTIDPENATFDQNNEPTATLKIFRNSKLLGYESVSKSGVFFGQNLDHGGVEGDVLTVGDYVTILS